MPFHVHFLKHFGEIEVHVLDLDQQLLQVHLLEDDLGDHFHLMDVVCQLVLRLARLETAAHLLEEVHQRVLIEDEDPELGEEVKVSVLLLLLLLLVLLVAHQGVVVLLEVLADLVVRVELLKPGQAELSHDQQETWQTGHLRDQVNVSDHFDF